MGGKANRTVRCAPYCRVSVSERLEQDFNSLDAQREACESFIASQKDRGWVCLPERYDDPGFSGSNTDRPALQKLLQDIQAGKVDRVIVHRIDRLSRSLRDFCTMVEVFERHGVGFVSVTQALDTSSPMGRLTLNILLSFAEFEREMICARTRDKMAAVRRKGKWSGGIPVLGYDLASGGGRLVVNEKEAERVRDIFNLYLERKGLLETVKELEVRGWRRKEWTTQKGVQKGGGLFTKNSLQRLLTNVTYLGKSVYKGEIHQGEHSAIVDEKVFNRVQHLLKRNGASGNGRTNSGSLLKGLLYCAPCGCAMSATYTKKGNRRYRYYVCLSAQKLGWHSCPSKSVPAGEIEKFVIDQIRCIGKDAALKREVLKQLRSQARNRQQELQSEHRGLSRDLKKHNAALAKLAGQEAAVDRMSALLEKVRVAEARLEEVDAELASLRKEGVDEATVARILEEFDSLWETLTPGEQAQVVRLLIERIDYDGEHSTVKISFLPTGIQSLSEEMGAGEAA